MARIEQLDAEERASFRIGDRLERPIRVDLAPGEGPTTAPPMLWRTGVETIDQNHDAVGQAAPLVYYAAPNAIIGGHGAQPRIGDGYLTAPTLFPHYVPFFIDNEEPAMSRFWVPAPDTRPRRIDAGISIIHFNLVFGHWLLEMFPKLLMLRSVLDHLRDAPIVLPSNAPRYIFKTIRQVLGRWPIVTYDPTREHVEVGALILPSMFHDNYFFHSRFTAAVEAHVAWARASVRRRGLWQGVLGRRDSGPRLFVSRRFVESGFRALRNADALEALAVKMGFDVIFPERMSWAHQVAAFSRAEVVAGEFGSGMHNTLFSPEGARVVCLNWIVEPQSRIANLRRQRIGYVLPPDGQPRLFGLDGRFSDYEIDPAAFRQGLELALAAGD